MLGLGLILVFVAVVMVLAEAHLSTGGLIASVAAVSYTHLTLPTTPYV